VNTSYANLSGPQRNNYLQNFVTGLLCNNTIYADSLANTQLVSSIHSYDSFVNSVLSISLNTCPQSLVLDTTTATVT